MGWQFMLSTSKDPLPMVNITLASSGCCCEHGTTCETASDDGACITVSMTPEDAGELQTMLDITLDELAQALK